MLAKFSKPPGCADCALQHLGNGFAPRSGPDSRLLFVGEALGYTEAMAGFPFAGAAGGMFDRVLRRAQIKREFVGVHNVVNCQPPGDWLDGAPWQHSAMTHCRQYLQESLDAKNLQVVVTLGGIPLRQVLDLWGVDGVRVQDFHGTVHRDPSDRFWVVPTYHPSHLQRGATNLLDVVRFDLSVAQGILAKGGPTRRAVSLLLDPPVERFARWVSDFLARLAHEGFAWLATDIETPDKSGGRDEGELSTEDNSTQILRVNGSDNGEEGWTVPYEGPYVPLIDSLLNSGAWLALWNKGYDESRLRFNGHKFVQADRQPVTLIDFMWAAHHLQSDFPLGLGFWAPFHSDYGAWKHLGKQKGMEAEYAAVDGVQTYRVGPEGIAPQLQAEGLWDAFWRHTHLREQYVLRPAHQNGMPVDKDKLHAFHEKLQGVAAERLESINQSELSGNFYPKEGYPKYPAKACPNCGGTGLVAPNDGFEGCATCQGSGWTTPKPPAGISGEKHRKKGDAAKADYIDQGIELVTREIEVEVAVCRSCGKRSVGPSHNCLRPRKSRLRPATDALTDAGEQLTPEIVRERETQQRYFWKLPFNPDASQQILKFIKDSGEQPGRAKKTRKETSNKETLKKLYRKTGNKVYKDLIDYKAVKKVDSTYALGLTKRIWADGRVHPFITFRPSMMRDSSVNPNIQNIIADKEGKTSLAAGLRYCIVADPGYRIIEIDLGGTEAIDTGWYLSDPTYIRLATLGVHAYLTSHVLKQKGTIKEAASLSWSDQELAEFFKGIKKKFAEDYDKCKRVVHGNNYGLTTFGMVENFPDVFTGGLKEANYYQDLYYALVPGLPAFHQRLRDVAYETDQIGGPQSDDYHQLISGKFHPFAYRHKFYGVQTYKPLTESEYRKLQWIAQNRMKKAKHPRVRMINNRPFEVVLGEDSKRVIAMYPQSTSSGKLKEHQLALLHPDSPDYIGEIADGKTPFIAPIHDSLLFHVPDRFHEFLLTLAINVMRRPMPQMPCPPEWGIGSHIRTNVSVKVSPVGGSWGDVEEIKIPDMAPATAMEGLYIPDEPEQMEDIQDLETRL